MTKIGKIDALGTSWWFEIFSNEVDKAELEAKLCLEIDQFEDRYSRFKKDSLLSQLNIERSFRSPPEEFKEIVQLAKDFYLKSGGVFNPFLAHILESKGYGKTFEGNQSTVSDFDVEDILVSADLISLPEGAYLDIGGFGKGFLIEKLAKKISQYGYDKFLINGGGDIYLQNSERKEMIYLEDQLNTGTVLGEIHINQGSLSVSSPHKRVWKNKVTNEEFTHLVTPTNEKVNLKSAFIFSENVCEADMLATTMTFLDDHELIKKLRTHFQFEFLIQDDGRFIKSEGFPQIVNSSKKI